MLQNVFARHLVPPPAPGALIGLSLQACVVHTSETIRVCYFLERLVERRRPVMLVGTAGTGKSVLVGTKLASLDAEEYLVKNVPFNYYTTSAMLQGKGPQRVWWGHGGGGVSVATCPVVEMQQSIGHLCGLPCPVPALPSRLSLPFSSAAPLFHSSSTLRPVSLLLLSPAFLPGLSHPSRARSSAQNSTQSLDARESRPPVKDSHRLVEASLAIIAFTLPVSQIGKLRLG